MKSARFPLGHFLDQDVYNSLIHCYMIIDRMNLPDKRSGATVILFALQFDILAYSTYIRIRIYTEGQHGVKHCKAST